MMNQHPILYQINIRVWRHRFGQDTELLDIPTNYWQQLAELGVEYVWLMGVWQTGPNVHDYAIVPGLTDEYSRTLPDWQPADVIGSPYAIDRYELHRDLGQPADLKELKRQINAAGLQLILDFVPNHFHAETSWLQERPDAFLTANEEWLAKDAATFYRPPNLPDQIFAHGKDPYFTAWQDTLQVNYARPSARDFMQEQLLQIAEYCDGVRCDMAMLLLPAVFERTWGHVLEADRQTLADFWPDAIRIVKERHPGFTFLAEVYWDLEWDLQQQGFDYTYDKRLLDRLHEGHVAPIREHLLADAHFQQHSARFLENHDEDRFLHRHHFARARAAALITYTLPGLRFFYQGQWEGRELRLPVQLGREPLEASPIPVLEAVSNNGIQALENFQMVRPEMTAFYHYLLQLLKELALQNGTWEQHHLPSPLGEQLLSWHWQYAEQRIWILVNYSERGVNVSLSSLQAGRWRYYLQDQVLSDDQYLKPYDGWVLIQAAK